MCVCVCVSRRCRGGQALWGPRLRRHRCHCRHHTESLLEGRRPGPSPGGRRCCPCPSRMMNTNHPSSICSARSQAGLGAGCCVCWAGAARPAETKLGANDGLRSRMGASPSCCGGRSMWTGWVLRGEPDFRVPATPLALLASNHLYRTQVHPVGQDIPEPVLLPVPEPLFRFCGTTLRHLEQLVTKGEDDWGGSRG